MQALDIATMFGVRRATVRDWMARRGLPYLIWPIGYGFRRVVLSTELFDWMYGRMGRSGDGSRVDKLLTRHQVGGRNAAKQRVLNRVRREQLAAQSSNSSDLSSP